MAELRCGELVRGGLFLSVCVGTALLVGPSCSTGGGGRTIPGYGSACTTDADCTKYQLRCDSHLGCVECFSNTDCYPGETCSSGACHAAIACRSAANCPSGLLCDTAASRCVECIRDSDCASRTDVCKSGVCVGGGTGGTSSGGAAGSGNATGTGGNATGGSATGGSNTGGTNTGGSGTGGSGTGGTPVVCTPGVIDDMEQNLGGALPPCEGRSGAWYTFNDGYCGNQYPAPGTQPFPYSTPGASGSGHCMSTFGTCGTASNAYGAAIAFSLVWDDTLKKNLPYDARSHGYTGIRFNARSDYANSSMYVTFPDIYTTTDGGFCTTCYDDYGVSVTLSSTWQTYTVLWTQLTHGGWGVPNSGFAPNGIYDVDFRFSAGTTFSVYIDDVKFVP